MILFKSTDRISWLRRVLCRFFAKKLYPVNLRDWYKNKGYLGSDDQERFENFLLAQTKDGAPLFGEFNSLRLRREMIKSGQSHLDSVMINPDEMLASEKPGEGAIFVMFQGRGEYYESRFRDMARLARYTGASVLGFNPKGFHSSSGKTLKISDIIEDGINVVESLLQKGFKAENIIIFGNSIGAAIGAVVAEYFYNKMQLRFRQINSNSFRNLAAVIAYHYWLPFLERFLYKVMKFAEWEISYSEDFYKTGPYRCCMRRAVDKTIPLGAEYYGGVDYVRDYQEAPDKYKEALQWLHENNQLIYLGKSKQDPHEMSLYNFKIKVEDDNGDYLSVFHFINFYLKASNKFN